MNIKKASLQEKEVAETLMQAYLHEMSEFDGSTPSLHGRIDCGSYFPLHWTEPGRFAYLFRDSGVVVGFALVRQLDPESYSVAEFFICRDFRSKGMGRRFAKALLGLHQGTWHVAQLEANLPAQKFWRSVITDYTAGNFSEGWSDGGPRGPKQTFKSTPQLFVAAEQRPCRGMR